MLSHLLLYGNSYCQILRSGRSRSCGTFYCPTMAVDRDTGGKLTYTYTTSEGPHE